MAFLNSNSNIDRLKRIIIASDRKAVKNVMDQIPIDINHSSEMCEALHSLHNDNSISTKVSNYVNELINSIRAKTRKMNIDELQKFSTNLMKFRRYLDCTSAAIISIMFGADRGCYRASIAIFSLINDCYYSDFRVHYNVKDYLISKGSILYLIWEFILFFPKTHIWENLLTYAEVNQDALKVLKNFLMIKLISEQGLSCTSYEKWESYLCQNNMNMLRNIDSIPFPTSFINFGANIIEELAQISRLDSACELEVSCWFGNNIEYFEQEYQRMWKEITNEAGCWLRNNGADRVKMNIVAYKNSSHTLESLQFIVEGLEFPKVIARFWHKVFDSPYITDYHINSNSLNEFSWLKDNHDVNSQNYAKDILRSIEYQLYIFIATHCLWRIVCKVEADKIGPSVSKRSARKIIYTKTSTEVRPHFRWLSGNQQPSEEAINRSFEIFNYAPPPGKTFVKTHTRNLVEEFGEMQKIPELFTYDESDFGYIAHI